jgi:hypothetical protein
LERGVDELLGAIPQLGALHDLVDAALPLGARDALDVSAVEQIFADAHLFVERGVLGEVADPRAGLEAPCQDIEAVDQDAPRARRDVARDDPHRRRLASAVWPQEAKDVAILNFKAQAAKGLQRAVNFCQVADLQHHNSQGVEPGCFGIKKRAIFVEDVGSVGILALVALGKLLFELGLEAALELTVNIDELPEAGTIALSDLPLPAAGRDRDAVR